MPLSAALNSDLLPPLDLSSLSEPPPHPAVSPNVRTATEATITLVLPATSSPNSMRDLADLAISAGLRVERVTQPVTEEIEGQHGNEDHRAVNDHEHRVGRVKADRVRQHAAP